MLQIPLMNKQTGEHNGGSIAYDSRNQEHGPDTHQIGKETAQERRNNNGYHRFEGDQQSLNGGLELRGNQAAQGNGNGYAVQHVDAVEHLHAKLPLGGWR